MTEPVGCAACPPNSLSRNTVGAFCPGHEQALAEALADLPNVYAELREIYGDPAQNVGGDKISHTRPHPPIPVRADVDETLMTISEVVFSWEHRVRATLGLPTARYAAWGQEHDRIKEACRFLSDCALTLLSLPMAPMMRPAGVDEYGGADAGLEILNAHRSGHAKTRPTRPVYTISVPCPTKGCASLWLCTHGGPDADAWCTGCGNTIPAEDYDQLLTAAAQETT